MFPVLKKHRPHFSTTQTPLQAGAERLQFGFQFLEIGGSSPILPDAIALGANAQARFPLSSQAPLRPQHTQPVVTIVLAAAGDQYAFDMMLMQRILNEGGWQHRNTWQA